MKHVFSCVDIGSSSIKLVVCELYKGRLNLLAASSIKSNGIKKGLIVDPTSASVSLKQAFTEVESMLGIPIKKVIAIIPSYFVDFKMIKGKINVNETITGENVIEVFKEAMKNNMEPTREMITIVPVDFTTDTETLKNPLGRNSSFLETRAIMVTTPKKNVYSVVSLINSIGVDVVDISVGCIGDIYALKTPENENKIGAIVNIGGEITTVSIYNKGIVVKSSIITKAGRNIENDIAYIYKLQTDEALKIKEKFASAHKNNASLNEIIEVTNKDGDLLKINQFEVSEIVMSRAEEILEDVKKEISQLTNKKLDYIYLTGGTSNFKHFDKIAREILGNCVIMGEVRLIGLRNNKFSSVLGNIIYFINKLQLKGKDYTMINNEEVEVLSSPKKNMVNVSNESMLGKVFGYFFGE